MAEVQRYDSLTILLHWLSAAAIAAMWGIAQIVDFFPRPERIWPISAHIVLGLMLVGIYGTRVFWKLTGGRHMPNAEKGVLGLAAVSVHHVLYLLIPITLLLGISLELIRGDYVFHLIQVPPLAPGNKDLREWVGDWHGLAANGLLILGGLHGAAALWHHFIKKDGVLERMRPAR